MRATQSRRRSGVPTLYYDELCPQFRSCYLLIKVLNIEVDLQPMNTINGDHSNESTVKKNHSTTIPTLIDGQCILSDGHTIMIYLCDKYADANLPHLCPRDYLPRLNVLNMLFYDGGILYPCYSSILTEILLKKYPNVDMSSHQAKVLDSYNTLDTNLKGQLCMTGNCFTIADIAIMTTLSSLDLMFPISQERWPNLHRWFENIKTMDLYKCNDEGLQKLQHLLETEGQFPLPSPLALENASAIMRSSILPSMVIAKDKLKLSKLEEHTEIPWNEKISLRQKFFKLFTKDNDRIPPTSGILRKSDSLSEGDVIATAPSEIHPMEMYPTSSARDIISVPSDDVQPKKKYPTFFPRVRINKVDIIPEQNEGQTRKKYPILLPRVRMTKFHIGPSRTDQEAETSPQLETVNETPVDKQLRESEVKSDAEVCQPEGNVNYKNPDGLLIFKKSQVEWSCMDCIQESPEC